MNKKEQQMATETFVYINDMMQKSIDSLWDVFKRDESVNIHIVVTTDGPGCYLASNDGSGDLKTIVKNVINKLDEQLNDRESFQEYRRSRDNI